MKNGWQSMDTAPQTGERITLYMGGRGAFEGWWNKTWLIDEHDGEPFPIAWRPLLPSPFGPEPMPTDCIGAIKKALNYIENTESELGIKLECGDALRNALAASPTDVTRNRVYSAIDSERDYQDRKWGKTLSSDRPGNGQRSIDEFITYILVYAHELLKQVTTSSGPISKLEIVRKIGALCVACMEQHGAPVREDAIEKERMVIPDELANLRGAIFPHDALLESEVDEAPASQRDQP